jgi:hypothetical protein
LEPAKAIAGTDQFIIALSNKHRCFSIKRRGVRVKRLIFFLFMLSTLSNAQESLHLLATITGKYENEQFARVSKAGDVNGDGYDDLLIAGWCGVKLYFGGSSLDTYADYSFHGTSCSAAGDVNSDGYDDILVGDPAFNESCGIVRLHLGGNPMDTIPDFDFRGIYYRQGIGGITSPAGDINGDGYDDFLVNSVYNEYDALGRVFLFIGGKQLKLEPWRIFMSDKVEAFFGNSATALDINQDGNLDICISSLTSMNTDSSMIHVYYGDPMDNVVDSLIYITDPTEQHDFINIISTGDVNIDSCDDFLANGGYYSSLYLGGVQQKVYFKGESIGAGGDINNDGIPDFLVGDGNFINRDSVMVGHIAVHLGRENITTELDYTMVGETKWGQFGYFSAIPGDLNGDGYDEVVVSAPRHPHHEKAIGKTYIYSFVQSDGVETKNVLMRDDQFTLSNYPNPFNAGSKINYSLAASNNVEATIYDMRGRQVHRLFNGQQESGLHTLTWNGRNQAGYDVPSGIYFCRVKFGEQVKRIKMALMR